MKSRTWNDDEPLAGDLHDGVAVGEDPDEPVVGHDQDAVGLGLVHARDRHVDRRVRGDRDRRRRAELVEVLAEQLALERRGLLRRVVAEEVGAAVVADVGADEVDEAARGTAHAVVAALLTGDDAVAPAYSTVQVSPPFSTRARSPSPDRATAAVSWSSMSRSWVGRIVARRTPTGTGKSGQNMRDRTSAR